MADKKISELNAITGANTADDDLFVIVDTSTNETKKIAKSELVSTVNAALIDGAPATLDTLNELAAALADDANFATTVTNSLAGKVDTTGDSMTGNLSFGDNDKAIFGAGSDLEIFHDGNNSYIKESGTGSLLVRGVNLSLQDSSNGENYLVCQSNNEVSMYFDGDKKLSTTSTGIDVTGTVTADGVTVAGSANNAQYAELSSSGLRALRLSSFSNNGNDNAGHDINASSSLGAVTLSTGGTTRFKVQAGGDISFYEDTGTTPKFFWDASAESLGIRKGVYSSTFDLNLSGEGIAIKNDKNGSDNNWSAIRNTATLSESNISFVTGQGEALVIDHFRNVGIGTSSPATRLHTKAGSNTQTDWTFTAQNSAGSAVTEIGGYGYNHNLYHRFWINETERMRIDSSGNLLVGTTAESNWETVAGFRTRPSGSTTITRSAAPVLYANRLTSDGNIVEFRKDGATVGSIGVAASDNLYFTGATGSTKGIYLNDNTLGPAATGGSGAVSDATTNLGASSARFKDLYLSGGVYLGGTGSANHLDDYEEGTWTPLNSTVAKVYHARYTKVGNLVTINTSFRLNSGQTTGTIALPFTPTHDSAGGNIADQTNNRYSGAASFFDQGTSQVNLMPYHQGNQGAAIYFVSQNYSGSQSWTTSLSDGFGAIAVSMTYHTSS